MVNRAGTEVEAKESTQTNANGFNVVHRKPKKGGASGDGADVHVTNVPAEFRDVEVLKRHHMFGKYGRVVKINVVAGPTKGKNATVSVTVTYSTSAEAGLAAHCVDGASLSGQTLSAKSSSPSPTTEPARRNNGDGKFLPAIPKSLQPAPTQQSVAATPESTSAAKPSESRKESKTVQNQSPANQTQQQKPVTTAAIAPGVSAWSKPLATSVSNKGTASYSTVAGSSTATSNASPTNATPAASAPAAAAKPTAAAQEQSPAQHASPTFGASGKQSQPQSPPKQQPTSTATTAAAVVRGNKGASPSSGHANGVVGGNVTLPAALSKFATVDASVEFGGDEAEGAPKMSNILDQPAPTGFTPTFAAPNPSDRGLFDADQHISSVLSDSGAIDNTPPRPTEVSHPAFDSNHPTTRPPVPQPYANANGAAVPQNAGRGAGRRPGSGARGPRRNDRPGQGSPMGSPGGLAGPPIVVPGLAAQPPQAGPLPPHFNIGRTKLNPEAPEFYPSAVRNPGLPGGIPVNDGRGVYGGGMYDPQYPPPFPQGAPQVPWGYPPAGGARGAPPFGAAPRGYWSGYGYQ